MNHNPIAFVGHAGMAEVAAVLPRDADLQVPHPEGESVTRNLTDPALDNPELAEIP